MCRHEFMFALHMNSVHLSHWFEGSGQTGTEKLEMEVELVSLTVITGIKDFCKDGNPNVHSIRKL